MGKQTISMDAASLFDRNMAEHYDESNSRLSPISDSLHFLLRLILNDLPASSRILCIGVGTGADILALAEAHPEWSFVGVDPSADMLEVCRKKLEKQRLLDRCELVHGYASDVSDKGFDVAISLFVAHFVSRAGRPDFYAAAKDRLRPDGYYVSTEICFDLGSPQFPATLENWKQIQVLMGASPESLEELPRTLQDKLTILSPEETEGFAKDAGFNTPVWFFQASMIRGWYAKKR